MFLVPLGPRAHTIGTGAQATLLRQQARDIFVLVNIQRNGFIFSVGHEVRFGDPQPLSETSTISLVLLVSYKKQLFVQAAKFSRTARVNIYGQLTVTIES